MSRCLIRLVAMVFVCSVATTTVSAAVSTEPGVLCVDGSKTVPLDQHRFFPDRNLELLALRLSKGYYADEAVYKRLVRDIGNIRAKNRRLEKVHYFVPNEERSLRIYFDAKTLPEVGNDRYQGWTCLNSYFGANWIDHWRFGYFDVELRGPYNLDKVADLYKKLPGVILVEKTLMVGGGSTIYVVRQGRDWNYVFDIAGGDCPAGCTAHELHLFKASATGAVKEIEKCDRGCKHLPKWSAAYRQYR